MIKLALIILLAAPLHAKPRAPLPGADELLLRALSGPATTYAGVERVQVFLEGRKPKSMKVNVFGSSSGRIRREVVPSGKKAKPLVQVRVRENAKLEFTRLRSLYDISVSTGGVVAKRKTWKLELRLKSGLLRRALWTDRASGLLMKRETYRDDGTLARRERFTRLELPAVVDKALFDQAMRMEPWSPDGFVFAGETGGARRWTNGLESYEVRTVAGSPEVTGLLAEDDAERVLGR